MARLVESAALQTAEAALTGESLPVTKDTAAIAEDVPLGDRDNMVFSGTAATYGHGKAVVTATGMRTEMGRIAGLLKETPDEATPLQRELDRTGKIARPGRDRHRRRHDRDDRRRRRRARRCGALFDVLILGVALAVAAVPEGLPAVVTAVLSIGVQRMARRNAIVRHLAAVETLGSATRDRVGQDGHADEERDDGARGRHRQRSRDVRRLGVRAHGAVRREGGRPIDGALRVELERALAAADRANNAAIHETDGRWTVQGDPTEGALLVAARKAASSADALDERLPRVGEVPFSSERKLMSTLHRDTEHQERGVVFTKGAPDVLLARCTESSSARSGGRSRRSGAPRYSRRTKTSRARRCGRLASPAGG